MRLIWKGRGFRLAFIAGIIADAIAANGAHAAGMFLYEMATPDLGAASAGRAATADTAATAFGNPAGMTRLDGSQLLLGAQAAYGITHFDKDGETTVAGGNGGNASGFAPGAAAYGVLGVSPDFKLGLSLGSNFGGDLRYQSDWSGRYFSQQSELITFGAYPVAAYRINDWLSVGVGAQIVYGRLNEKVGVNDVLGGGEGSLELGDGDVGYGGLAGVLIEPAQDTRIGLTYTSQVEFEFKDRPKTNNLGVGLERVLNRGSKVDLGLTIPNQVMLSGYHELTPKLALVGNVVWQQWSQFGKPTVEVTSTTSNRVTADLDYDDTWGFALGSRWRFAPDWLWMLGVAFDTSPQSKSNRVPALPMDQQVRVGTGAQVAINDRLTVGAAYEYLNLGDADISRSRPLAGTLQGKYSTNEVHFFNVTLSWVF